MCSGSLVVDAFAAIQSLEIPSDVEHWALRPDHRRFVDALAEFLVSLGDNLDLLGASAFLD